MRSSEIKWIQRHKQVYSTEEFTEFSDYVKQEGGHVIGTYGGQAEGVSVTYRLPGGSE